MCVDRTLTSSSTLIPNKQKIVYRRRCLTGGGHRALQRAVVGVRDILGIYRGYRGIHRGIYGISRAILGHSRPFWSHSRPFLANNFFFLFYFYPKITTGHGKPHMAHEINIFFQKSPYRSETKTIMLFLWPGDFKNPKQEILRLAQESGKSSEGTSVLPPQVPTPHLGVVTSD